MFKIEFHSQVDICFPNQVDDIENNKDDGETVDMRLVQKPVKEYNHKRHKYFYHAHKHIEVDYLLRLVDGYAPESVDENDSQQVKKEGDNKIVINQCIGEKLMQDKPYAASRYEKHHRMYNKEIDYMFFHLQRISSMQTVTVLLCISTNPSVTFICRISPFTENESVPLVSDEITGAWLFSIWNEPAVPGRVTESASPL
jgi:hypothetical protein